MDNRSQHFRAIGSNQTQLFYQPHAKRVKEHEFGAFLAASLGCPLRPGAASIDADPASSTISRRDLLTWLHSAVQLPARKREACLRLAGELPQRIAIGPSGRSYGCDFAAVRAHEPFYWEFHERQHRTLSVSRPENLFSPRGEQIEVPRYFQRLVRDLWRIQTCKNLTVVWFDYFYEHATSFRPELAAGYRELSLPTKFSFGRFPIE